MCVRVRARGPLRGEHGLHHFGFVTAAAAVLPDFERPPVTEVAMAVQFDSQIGFRAVDLFTVTNAWAEDLPVVDERSPLPRFGHFEVETSATPRLWLQNTSGDRVVQIQQDRLAVNWARPDTGDEYPRYDTIRDFLVDAWSRLETTIDTLGLGMPLPDSCQLRYTNELRASQGWESAADTAKLVAPWGLAMSDDFLPEVDGFTMHFHLPEDSGMLDIRGWQTEKDMFVLTLECEVWPDLSDFERVLDSMDLAHEWIVRSFVSVTTPAAHSLWGRNR